MVLALLIAAPSFSSAQQTAANSSAAGQEPNVPRPVQAVEGAVEDAVERFGIGVQAGVGLDPELIMFGAHARFAPVFHRAVTLRPALEFGVGEVTTMAALHFDVLYTLASSPGSRWTPYLGAGPNFSVSHRGFETGGEDELEDERNRFDFSDTDVDGGFNVVAGVQRENGMFLELKATAYGVTNIRLLAGFNF